MADLSPSQKAAITDRIEKAKAAGPAAIRDLAAKSFEAQFSASYLDRAEAVAMNVAAVEAVAALDAPPPVDREATDRAQVAEVIVKLRAEAAALAERSPVLAANKSAHADSLAQIIAPPTT
jgi:hypothetical protein